MRVDVFLFSILFLYLSLLVFRAGMDEPLHGLIHLFIRLFFFSRVADMNTETSMIIVRVHGIYFLARNH